MHASASSHMADRAILDSSRDGNLTGRLSNVFDSCVTNEKGNLLFKEFFEDEKSKSDRFLFPPPKYSPISKT